LREDRPEDNEEKGWPTIIERKTGKNNYIETAGLTIIGRKGSLMIM
jgi:hypothetical protein